MNNILKAKIRQRRGGSLHICDELAQVDQKKATFLLFNIYKTYIIIMLKIRQYKKKYKIILCDIFATILQFRIVLMFIVDKFLFQFIERQLFLCVKTNDNNIDLSIKNKTLAALGLITFYYH